MKDIMAKESPTQDGGVASFAYSLADKDTPYLLSFLQPVQDLKKKLPRHFAARTQTMEEIYIEFAAHTERHLFIVTHRLNKFLPDIYWTTVFGKP